MHIVFLSPTFDTPAPRTIRTRHIARKLSETHDVTVICFESLHTERINEVGLTVIRLPFSWMSKYVANKTDSGYKPRGLIRTLSRTCSFVLNRVFLFPDAWVLERQKIVSAITNLSSQPDVVVATAIPFSMAEIAILYRDTGVGSSLVVLDIGDPFVRNQYKRSLFGNRKKKNYESRFLQQADHAIVTNGETRDHYIEQYLLPENKVSVIAQGGVVVAGRVSRKSPDSAEAATMIYAGAFLVGLRDPRRLLTLLLSYKGKVELEVFGTIDAEFVSGYSHIKFQGRVPHEQMEGNYARAHCLLFVDNSSGIQTSGKIFELLSLKKPILFLYDNEKSVVKAECEKYDHILFVKNENSAIQLGLEQLRGFISQKHSYDYNVNDFSWENRAQQFEALLARVVHVKPTLPRLC